jgi:uncharacterized protein (TIGR03435 family)
VPVYFNPHSLPPPEFQIQPDGFRAYHATVRDLIQLAYIPHGEDFWYSESIAGAPLWVTAQPGDPKDLYDIYAKVAPQDIAAWQKQDPDLDPISTHKEMLEAMLQTMLADRFKLAVHLVTAETTGITLIVGKNGPSPALQPAPPTEVEPRGVVLAAGGVRVFTGKVYHNVEWTLHNATMASLAALLSTWRHSLCGPDPVVDKTGLTGRYDFVLRPAIIPTKDDPDAAWVGTPDTPYDLESLGLALVPARIPIQTVVVDHIERPSEN